MCHSSNKVIEAIITIVQIAGLFVQIIPFGVYMPVPRVTYQATKCESPKYPIWFSIQFNKSIWFEKLKFHSVSLSTFIKHFSWEFREKVWCTINHRYNSASLFTSNRALCRNELGVVESGSSRLRKLPKDKKVAGLLRALGDFIYCIHYWITGTWSNID